MKCALMALRIEEAVIRGEIDNTVEGRVTGRIWLLGRQDPLVLNLEGDCWRDLAGTRLIFENSKPVALPEIDRLQSDQTGVVGDITASRKARVTTVNDEELEKLHAGGEEIPHEWKTLFYLEWFSHPDGRVLIETTDFELIVSPHEWGMDEDEEQAQQLANLHAMRDFMASVIKRRERLDSGESADDLDEYEWEERLKESDRLADAYQEVLEKYMDDPDAERKEAFAMGWDGLLDALAERDETDEIEEPDGDDAPATGWSEDGDHDGEDERHPLQAMSYEIALKSIDLVPRGGAPDTASHCLVSNLLQVSAKLAGALNGHGNGYEPETGFILAVLKRCLNWLNEAMAACQALYDQEADETQKAELGILRQAVFELRDGIVELRRDLKQS